VDPALQLTARWNAVTATIDGDAVTVTNRPLIVEEDVEFDHPGFGRSLYSVHVPSSVTSKEVPEEALLREFRTRDEIGCDQEMPRE